IERIDAADDHDIAGLQPSACSDRIEWLWIVIARESGQFSKHRGACWARVVPRWPGGGCWMRRSSRRTTEQGRAPIPTGICPSTTLAGLLMPLLAANPFSTMRALLRW